jgi:acylphosphatase
MAQMRYDVTFTGHVQGVFFRATTEDVARGFDVTGYVRNQSDGSVRLVAEGVSDELDRFVEAVREAKRNNIADVRIDRTDATGEFDGFGVRR